MPWLKKIFDALSRKERVNFVIASAFALLSGALLLWLGFVNVTKLAPAQGGEYTEGFLGQPAYVNPLLAETPADKALVRLAFANLTDLADKVEVDKTGKNYRVRLKENLSWSDGQKLTSDDLIFTLQKLQDPQTASPYFGNWQGVSASRVSELEIQLTLASPYAFFPKSLESFYPVPKHLFADTPASNWKLSDYNLKPVGSGPYVFSDYEKRDDGFIVAYRLKANERYAKGRPYIEIFEVRFFTKAEDVIKAFNSGRIDAVADLDPETLKSIRRTYNLSEFLLPNYYAVFWNQSQNPALEDLNVRRALALATQKDGLLRGALYGYGREALGPIPTGIPGLQISYPPVGGGKEAANSLLESTGWKIGEDGIRARTSKGGGTELKFKLTVPDIPFLITTAKTLASEWERIGARAELEIMPADEIVSGRIKNRDYEAILFGNLLGANGDPYAFWHSSEKYYPGLNLALYGSKRADKLLESIRQNPDEASRADDFQALSDELISSEPALFLYSPSYLFVSSKDLEGVRGGFLGENADRLRSARDWYVKVARVFK
jgi:peptide/nickel transport system substrate-binding protein